MSEFKSALKPYDLERALAADRGSDCVVIDVGRSTSGNSVQSLRQVAEQVAHYINDKWELVFSATKLYVIGDWDLAPCSSTEEARRKDSKVNVCADATTTWEEATRKIKTLVGLMDNLKELTWVSGLPFTAAVWDGLPPTLAKLVIDLGNPVRLDRDGDVLHKSYMTANEMKPLLEQVKLNELRLFNVRDSLQSLVWETVFRNVSESGMRVLDLQMASAPIVRSDQWRLAKNVVGLTVPFEGSEENDYKGMDGKGILHFSIGTGEYLDGFCMRKARIASGLDEATPLPLWCLKLDGFVVDHLPFRHELSQIVLLTCGDNCVDSGLRAPKSRSAHHNKWSDAVNNESSHCLIQFPNWTGIFNELGLQRNRKGAVVSQELGLSTPADEFPPSTLVPLTKESLGLKARADREYFPDAPMSALSTLSTRGSAVASSLSDDALGVDAAHRTPETAASRSPENSSPVGTPETDSAAHSPHAAAGGDGRRIKETGRGNGAEGELAFVLGGGLFGRRRG